MIPVGTQLEPRADAPVVSVVGIHGSAYVLAPVDFGPTFQLDYDALTSAYVCDGFKVHIDPFSEAAAWAKLSSEKFSRGMRAADRRDRRQESSETPEMVFAREAKEREAA